MSRIDAKRLIALLTALVLLGTAAAWAEEQQDIIDASQLTPQQINYKTTEVVRGSYIKETMNSASVYYPLTYNIRFEQSNAKFVEYTVKRGQAVKAGDVLAKFTIAGSDVAFTRMEKNLQRTEEDTQRGIRQREEALSRLRAEIAAMDNGYGKEKAMLSLRRQEIELEQYAYRQQYSIEQQRRAYEEEKERRAYDTLISPVDGIVSELTYKKADDAVSAHETLVVISSEEVMLLRTTCDNGAMRYNMPVTVTMGNSKNQITLTGRIVAADDAIPEKERTGYVFIELDPYDTEEIKIRSPKITVESVRLDDVLILQRSAATLEAGKYFVNKLNDGVVQKRFIQFGMSSGQTTWAMAGVEEGETLVID